MEKIMEVKTFNTEKLVALLKKSDSYIVEYIESIKRTLEMSTQVNSKAIAELRKYKSQCADELEEFVDGERIVGADTHDEQINGQGRNQAYDIICEYLKKWRK